MILHFICIRIYNILIFCILLGVYMYFYNIYIYIYIYMNVLYRPHIYVYLFWQTSFSYLFICVAWDYAVRIW